MARETTPIDRDPILFFSGAIAGNQSFTAAQSLAAAAVYRVAGQKRLVGFITSTQVLAAAPTISWSVDGTNFDLVTTLVQDSAQTNPTFPFDIPVQADFVKIEFTNGATPGNIRATTWAFPEGAGPAVTGSGGTIYVKDAPLTPLGFNSFSVDGTTAKGLGSGSSIPAGARYAQVCLDSGGTNVACRFRYDGVAPTSALGMILNAGVLLPVETTPLSSFQIIGSAAGPTVVSVSFFS